MSVKSTHTSSTTLSTSLLRANPIACQRGRTEIRTRRANINTYLAPIVFSDENERRHFLASFYKKSKNSKNVASYRQKMVKKYAGTLGKYYKELVERSGRVSPEDFWQRYEYRCGSLSRVLQELQSTKQQLQKEKNKKMKKVKKAYNPSVDASTGTSGSKKKYPKKYYTSWMNVKSPPTDESSKQKVKSNGTKPPAASPSSSRGRGVQFNQTFDTQEEEMEAMVDHVEKFKQNIVRGSDGSHIVEASSMDYIAVLKDDDDTTPRHQPSIFRESLGEGNSGNAKSPVDRSLGLEDPIMNVDTNAVDIDTNALECKTTEYKSSIKRAVVMVFLWCLSVLMLSFAMWPNRAINVTGNFLCGPVQPGMVLSASILAQKKDEIGTKRVLSAPWWAPPSLRDRLFDRLCSSDAAGNERPRIQLVRQVHSKKDRKSGSIYYLTVAVQQVQPRNSEQRKLVNKTLTKIRRAKTISIDPSGTTIHVKPIDAKKVEKEFEAPWALT